MSADLPGLRARALDVWLRAALPNVVCDEPWVAEMISGGLSNITYRIRLPNATFILRRPPLGQLLPRAHDIQREYRVLTALTPTQVPVPDPLALCSDAGVLGVSFYVMSEVPGDVLRRPSDTERLAPPARTALAEAMIGTLIDLHSVDPDAVGLGDYGKRGGYCARQIRTWAEQWRRSRTRDLPDMEGLIAGLSEHAPQDSGCTIVHGDYRLDNTIIDNTGWPRIAAVLDWELSTLGDPLADLGLMLTYWHDLGDDERAQVPVAAGVTAKPGFPTGRELAEIYAARTGRHLDNLPFYLALGAMKLAVILEGVHARYLGGQSLGEGYESAEPAVPILAARGLRTLSTFSRGSAGS